MEYYYHHQVQVSDYSLIHDAYCVIDALSREQKNIVKLVDILELVQDFAVLK